jgi:ribosomal protein S18 acetylase RimI-like enzyme
MDVEVRPAGIEDADGIAEVHVRTWQAAYAGIVPEAYLASLDVAALAERRRGWLAEAAAGTTEYRTLVAVDDRGRIIGFVSFGPYRLELGRMDRSVGEVQAIYVHPDAQGLGVGRALMDGAVTALADRGAAELRLWVFEDNAPSRRFYERYGLATDGARGTFRVDPPGGDPVDLAEVRYAMRL